MHWVFLFTLFRLYCTSSFLTMSLLPVPELSHCRESSASSESTGHSSTDSSPPHEYVAVLHPVLHHGPAKYATTVAAIGAEVARAEKENMPEAICAVNPSLRLRESTVRVFMSRRTPSRLSVRHLLPDRSLVRPPAKDEQEDVRLMMENMKQGIEEMMRTEMKKKEEEAAEERERMRVEMLKKEEDAAEERERMRVEMLKKEEDAAEERERMRAEMREMAKRQDDSKVNHTCKTGLNCRRSMRIRWPESKGIWRRERRIARRGIRSYEPYVRR